MARSITRSINRRNFVKGSAAAGIGFWVAGRGDWARAVREACTSAANADLDYGDPRGSLVLREVLAGYLRRVRAADADAARLIACTGFAQGLLLALRALVTTGSLSVAFEDPGYGSPENSEVKSAVTGTRILNPLRSSTLLICRFDEEVICLKPLSQTFFIGTTPALPMALRTRSPTPPSIAAQTWS